MEVGWGGGRETQLPYIELVGGGDVSGQAGCEGTARHGTMVCVCGRGGGCRRQGEMYPCTPIVGRVRGWRGGGGRE